ncbi:hypothetical protein Pmani_035082 [Petrolisthes manimaculis]|uniref:Uncharacterized protein n=1 Tax=Petrolisthes manimaculis TaxID=1843537 RepID=A0AAE1TNJ3_9EUCA|nr:hypothetical protein Pmani_035082 [Petrolisthes manimaculis]
MTPVMLSPVVHPLHPKPPRSGNGSISTPAFSLRLGVGIEPLETPATQQQSPSPLPLAFPNNCPGGT